MGQGESGYIFNPTPLKEVLPDILIGPNPKLLRIKVGVRGRVEARPLARRQPGCRQSGLECLAEICLEITTVAICAGVGFYAAGGGD